MELEVGDYIRTIDGIKRIVKINDGDRKTIFGQYRLDKPYKGSYSIAEKNILEHNKDIKKLIKEGDYVNGCKIQQLFEDEEGEWIEAKDQFYKMSDLVVWRIVTKEQFASVEYKVGEE